MRKICIITGTRADYGLFQGLMKEIQSDDELQLQVVATGMHLSDQFASTYQEIVKDGFAIDEKVEMPLVDDSPHATTKSIGLAVMGFADAFLRLKPDIIVLLGDRIEMLAAGTAALIGQIPLAHIHGGELTYGAFDDSIRHAITKMALLHFPSAEAYQNRIIQMGEMPNRVFCVGALGIENITRLSLLSQEELENSINFKIKPPTFLVTYHPVTLEKNSSEKNMKELLAALDSYPQANIIFTYPNSDPDNKIIRTMIEEYVEQNSSRAAAFISLGQIRYLSALKYVDLVIGNSSSGVIEVPSFKKATINIGDRQKGRLMAGSVLNCAETKADIIMAINKALSTEFQQKLLSTKNIFEGVEPAKKIKNILKTFKLDSSSLKKEFHDI